MNSNSDIIGRVRTYLEYNNLDALIVPSADPHQSEHTQEHDQCRAYVSGFTGSAGTVVVTRDEAGLWTDSRYFLAAERALAGTGIVLHRLYEPGTQNYPEWLAAKLSAGTTVGVDAAVIKLEDQRSLETTLAASAVGLRPLDDPFAELWPDRPPMRTEKVYRLPDRFVGESAGEKLERLRTAIEEAGAASHVVATLDDIAWILNLRGSDVRFNPVFRAYLTVRRDGAVLYRDPETLSKEAIELLEEIGVTVAPYGRFAEELPELPEPVLLDPRRTGWAIKTAFGDATIIERPQPSTLMKACKNATELTNLAEAMRRDGVALTRFFAWLDRIDPITEHLDEVSLAERLRSFRREGEHYIGDSFAYISGFGPNGAIVHYDPDKAGPTAIDTPGIYLIDSGAQYFDGTTDVTRVVPIGLRHDDDLLRRAAVDHTFVLKGHIALARLRFPRGTSGRDIDAIARAPIWAHGRSFGHGTGHGVGYVLNVHEGPQKIAPGADAIPLEPGMIISNEPGVYREGEYGIRFENLVVVAEDGQTEFGEFLRFETLTLAPIDRRLIAHDLLDRAEREWLNRYHQRVYAELSPHMNAEDAAWLENACRPLTEEE